MIEKDTFNIVTDFHGAKGLVHIGEKIIVIRRDSNTNSFPLCVDIPGGGREAGESPFETFRREIFEELGIEIIKEDIIFSKRYTSVVDSSQEAYLMVTRPLSIAESDIHFGDEGLEYFLIAPQEFVNLLDGVPGQQERVRDYLKMQ